METIQSQKQGEELKKVVERIVKEIEKFSLYKGTVSMEKVLPPAGTPGTTPEGFSHLAIYTEERKYILGLIPYKKKR